MDYDNIKKLIDDIGCSKLSEFHIELPDGTKISMKKDNLESLDEHYKKEVKKEVIQKQEENKVIVENKSQDILEEDLDECEYRYIKSPMVGTFYSKPSPNEKSFVEVGQSIKKGCTTCIIEAMKLMNEIEAEIDGEVVEILKQDGEPVEFGENLIRLR